MKHKATTPTSDLASVRLYPPLPTPDRMGVALFMLAFWRQCPYLSLYPINTIHPAHRSMTISTSI